MEGLSLIWEWVKAFFSDVQINYILDIGIVSFAIYNILKIIKETRAEQLVKGFLVILVIAKLSEWFHFYAVNFILESTFTVGLIALVILFQPELRKGLEHMGRTNWIGMIKRGNTDNIEPSVNEIIDSVSSMSRKKIGALIVIERYIGINDIIETGTFLDAQINSQLISNIFFPKSPLHDGAMIIKNMRICAAGCLLPLSQNKFISKDLGTRHRAAMGMTESSDALIIVVSEETGAISMAHEGKLHRFLDPSTLREILLTTLRGEAEEENEKK